MKRQVRSADPLPGEHGGVIASTNERMWLNRMAQVGSATSSARRLALVDAATLSSSRPLKRLARFAGPIGGVIVLGLEVREVHLGVSAYRRGRISRRQLIVRSARSGGGLAGAVSGAIAGGYFGGLGGPAAWITAPAGAAIGGVAGYTAGSVAGGAAAEGWYRSLDENVREDVDALLSATPYSEISLATPTGLK